MRGYAAIGLVRPKFEHNVGGALRAAFCFDAALVAIAGERHWAGRGIKHCTNTQKAERHIPVICGDDLHDLVPFDCEPVAVDLIGKACPLHSFQHPMRAFYIFGPEDGTLGEGVLSWCKRRVMIPTRNCMNLAATINVVLYDRQAKALRSARLASAYGLTRRQEDVLSFIRAHVGIHGVPPTYREIAAGLGFNSTTPVYRSLVGLKERGAIDWLPARARSIATREEAPC
jgi:tRNA(Leu) C34 or U34 (ribose-2'-O)-methylase TrmL